MLQVYLNYPTSRVEVHGDPWCGQVLMYPKRERRMTVITAESYEAELLRFERDEYPFTATDDGNDLWLRISLGDETQELKALGRILAALGPRYPTLDSATVARHC
jgi:hypothetical protein